MLLNVCLLVLRLLIFGKFAGAPQGQKHKYGMGAPHRASSDKFKAPLSYVE